jgi:aspartyl-tRNA(Asn)/glutamyl-tRNA(Gln) amidotransferase subunit A
LKNYLSLREIQKDLSNKNISCVDLVRGYIKNINLHPQLNAFIDIYEQEALCKAESIDIKLKKKTAGKLAGLVIGIKDNICYKNHSSSAASKILQNFQSNYSATVVERLLDADAIILGRLNCDEFAMGSSNENSIYGPVRNPINLDFVSGGSSGGSAAAVRANLCQVALGSDTGGSVRQPAAFCGVMGLKPTYGLVSRHGLIAYASSFDQIGPITKSLDDIFDVMSIISGKDDFDSTCTGENINNQLVNTTKVKNFAVLQETLDLPSINLEIKQQFEKLIERLLKRGHRVNYVKLPLLEYLVPTYYILTTAEASSNLARYDGIKYGYQSKTPDTKKIISSTRGEGFGAEVKRRVLLGTYVLSEGYYDAYYIKAQKIRRLIKTQTKNILSTHDFILSPTTPNLPFPINTQSTNPTEQYVEDVFTVQANLSGNPALAFPIGEVSGGFSASAQIMGDYFSELEILNTVQDVL